MSKDAKRNLLKKQVNEPRYKLHIYRIPKVEFNYFFIIFFVFNYFDSLLKIQEFVFFFFFFYFFYFFLLFSPYLYLYMNKISPFIYCTTSLAAACSATPALIPSTHSLAALVAGMLASNFAKQQS